MTSQTLGKGAWPVVVLLLNDSGELSAAFMFPSGAEDQTVQTFDLSSVVLLHVFSSALVQPQYMCRGGCLVVVHIVNI